MKAEIEQYIDKHKNFAKEIVVLRNLIVATNLLETIKWGRPTYTLDGKNVVGIGAFRSHFGLWFFKGALLADRNKVLLNTQEGKTAVMRQWRFEKETVLDQNLIQMYIEEAIEIEKKGLKILSSPKSLVLPLELTRLFNENKKLSIMFDALTNGKKREFAEYISKAKRETTKQKRLDKIVPMILNSIGLNDKYKNC